MPSSGRATECRLKRVAQLDVERGAIWYIAATVVSPRRTDGRRHRQKVPRDGVDGQLQAKGRLHVARAKTGCPYLTGVRKSGRVNRSQEQRPSAESALRSCKRDAVLDVRERCVPAPECVAWKSPHERGGSRTEIDQARVASRPAHEKRAAECRVAG